ncbi:hypothetical protein FB567DRAFT_228209 [Paraphoma chrysanthemicola]|uniref:F-box domain-containing protein n=1 Tax=Paraphoma chrysanthemicola TaxID=798071 RepID=A0A8K0RDU6_9PLEO|nr:hypothetical protein FB567DRAFT_228209 [Paraphoma chrysanthemicola]
MADATAKKGGFRALFGRRSNAESSGRKKLSKKGSHSEASGAEKLGAAIVANPQRQDSGSFTSQSIDLTTSTTDLPSYDDVTSFNQTHRDSPYAATNLIGAANRTYQQVGSPFTEYRRNSEGQQQFAVPLYQSYTARSASMSQFEDGVIHDQSYSSPASKAPPAKLSKAHRMPKPEELLDKDTGERKDLTDMMHAFTFNEELDVIDEKFDTESLDYDPSKPDGTAMLGNVSPEVWLRVADFLTPLDVANLSSTCRTLYTRLGRHPHKLLSDPTNRVDRLNFLLAMDHKLPRHLFCFPCAQWHLRIQPGLETLKPHHILNPLFECPNRTNIHLPPPRIRISDGRMLPFAFVQLARRSWAFGPDFGISYQSLARRWKDPYSEWTHESMYHVTDNGHVMMRVKSQRYVEGGMTAAAKRMLLFSRGDYTPYFSVCSHWKNGILTSIPKCALDHIPFVPDSEVYVMTQVKEKVAGRKAIGHVNLCSRCRPMRRCPECPTEYLFELKLVEDKTVRSHSAERFKQALVVSRWSDLGPGRSPEDQEWAAIAGETDMYDSFLEIGRRAISGVFESAFTDTIPGQRILSSNPKKVKADEIGGDWY